MTQASPSLKVYFDNMCVVCATEINHYRKLPGSDKIQFIDITALDFNAAVENVDPKLVHKYMHVKKSDGQLVVGPEAFVEIWKLLPKYHWAAKVAEYQVSKWAMKMGYTIFVVMRPYLPRKKVAADCSQSPFCEINQSKT